MKKIDKIDSCMHCPLHARPYDARYDSRVTPYKCMHPENEGQIIGNLGVIPIWCPLPEDV